MSAHSWQEIGAGVFQLPCPTYHLNVTAVLGAHGVLVVDTRASLAEGRELRAELRALTSAPVAWVVNSHLHFDHTFGNAEFVPPRQVPGAQLWAHVNAIGQYPAYAAQARAELIAEGGAEALAMDEQEFAVPQHAVREHAVIDLGGRVAELSYHGRGHTDGDIAILVPDAGVLVAGDLMKEHGKPGYWPDCFPLEWPATLASVLTLAGPGTVIVPGHGRAVGAGFAAGQQAELQAVADEITRLHRAGVPAEQALAEGSWPYDSPRLPTAIRRGYAALNAGA